VIALQLQGREGGPEAGLHLSSLICSPNIGDAMSLSIKKTKQSVGIRDTGGRPCGTYHYEDMFKSFFRGLYSPSGKDVVACPPVQDPHHKGLQFGLCTSVANFWEEDEANEPITTSSQSANNKPRSLSACLRESVSRNKFCG
jgi:hypothetical protein